MFLVPAGKPLSSYRRNRKAGHMKKTERTERYRITVNALENSIAPTDTMIADKYNLQKELMKFL